MCVTDRTPAPRSTARGGATLVSGLASRQTMALAMRTLMIDQDKDSRRRSRIRRSRPSRSTVRAASSCATAAPPGVAWPRLGLRAGHRPGRSGEPAALTATRNPKFVAADQVEHLRGHHDLQQLLRVRHREERPGAATPARLKVKPWTVKVDGLVAKPGNYAVEDLVDFKALEERVYRLRCVEALVDGHPLDRRAAVGRARTRCSRSPAAKFVEFTTLLRPSEMPGQRPRVLDWPYVEGLRMDEAMHPLTLMVVGLYGKVLPNQNGAPLRVHIPWKYGFKSGKSIVRIRFTDKQPQNDLGGATPHEYGFYANVNPTVGHPRWSQAREAPAAELLQEHADADVQRLRRSGGQPLHRHGPAQELLMHGRAALARRRAAIAAVVNSRCSSRRSFWRALAPGVWLGARLYLVLTGADPRRSVPIPTKLMQHETGRNALTILLFTLTVTPIRRLFGQSHPDRPSHARRLVVRLRARAPRHLSDARSALLLGRDLSSSRRSGRT